MHLKFAARLFSAHSPSASDLDSLMASILQASFPRYGLSLCPFTVVSPEGVRMRTAPYGNTSFTSNGPNHLDFNFPGNNLIRELKSKTCCPTENYFCAIFAS